MTVKQDETRIRELFNKHNVALGAAEVWEIERKGKNGQKFVAALAIKHSAIERLAATIGIKFELPQILFADTKSCAMIVRATLGEVSEWSTGEATPDNIRGYPIAMAEKRAKDRVAIKLAGLHGVYSEEEAEDFRQPGGRSDEEIEEGRQRVEAVGGKGIREYQNEDRRDATLAKVVTSGRLDPPVQRDAFNLPPVDDGAPTEAEVAHDKHLRELEGRLRERIEKNAWQDEAALKIWFDLEAVQGALRQLETTTRLQLSVLYENKRKELAKRAKATAA